MQTVYARLPENPNVTLKLRVSSDQKHDDQEALYERHFSSSNPPPIGLLFNDKIPFTEDAVQRAPIRGVINALSPFVSGEGRDRERGIFRVNDFIVHAIISFETQDISWMEKSLEEFTINEEEKTKIEKAVRVWLDEESARVSARVSLASLEGDLDQLPVKIFIEKTFQGFTSPETTEEEVDEALEDSNALAATLQEYYEEETRKEDGKSLENIVSDAVDTYFADRISKQFKWNDAQKITTKWYALQWLGTRRKVTPFSRAEPPPQEKRGEQEDIFSTPQGTPQVTPRQKAKPQAEPLPKVTEEELFVRQLERNLDETMRRALSPLYRFIGGLAVALSDADVRRFYTYKNQRGVTLEELQRVVRMGNKTLEAFYDANKHLGDLLLTYAVDVQLQKDAFSKKKSPAKRIAVSNRINFAGVIDQGNNYRRNFREYARQAALLPMDEKHPDIADWYYCAMPYSVFWELLSSTSVAAMEMAASDIWRFTGRKDFTIPLMIKSEDTRDIFVLMTRNKYIISTGSIYSESLFVGQGGASKRYQTGSGSVIREKRAAENLAGKHWWQDVVLIKDDSNRERRQRMDRIKDIDKGELERLKTLLDLVIDYKKNPEKGEALTPSIREAAAENADQVCEDITNNVDGFIENLNDDIDYVLRRTHCYDTMMHKLKYIYSPAPYGGGSFHRRRFF